MQNDKHVGAGGGYTQGEYLSLVCPKSDKKFICNSRVDSSSSINVNPFSVIKVGAKIWIVSEPQNLHNSKTS